MQIDIMMPEMDGCETIHRIRKNKKYQLFLIIALTAKVMKGDREKCIMAGASDYVHQAAEQHSVVVFDAGLVV